MDNILNNLAAILKALEISDAVNTTDQRTAIQHAIYLAQVR